ncbi:hypothetical protein AOL_s00083g379 [Orbilia oligospora ATCC 24927]|uniref:Uncharacterized protein n=1 Tax=Arthrobotrys oligospora (strain ATCC 24927 / CBS 115.81 / DSM 1491) TaxID=756982 RepID=G1XH98_ARTOA|nr:hypothetical protein AOL_s00083g379 [Orbilia oligospora ATCC 24927]EGX47443.1 hypothetical protein AOL_s00083g379 [Orbilia oligospora ATCC 24927]
MLSFNQSNFPTAPYPDTTAAALFHLTPTSTAEGYQSQLQQSQTLPINTLPLPMILQDDMTGLDFSNPSVQEYIINNDVLDSLAQEVALADNPSSSSSSSSSSASMATNLNLQNINTTAELLINTPLIISQTPSQISTTTTTAGLQNGTSILNGTCGNTGGVIGIGNSTLDVQVDQFSTMQEETTLSLGVMAHLENLEKQIAEMRRFVSAGFAKKDHVRGLDVERQRLHSRNYNFQNVTEINEPFQILLNSNGTFPSRCPVNGVELKSLNHEEMDALLDEYDLPFSPALFLHEKQLMYLRFIGTNRAVMHRVVD